VPGRPHLESLRQGGQFTRRGQAADLRKVYADEINQPLGNESGPFMRAVEQFSHGDRGAALLPQRPKIADGLGRERVFDEERMVALKFLAKPNRLDRLDALMDVMQQFDFLPELLADALEHLGVVRR